VKPCSKIRTRGFIKEVEHTISDLPEAEPDLPELALDLRAIGIVKRRAMLSQQFDASQHLTANGLGQPVKPGANRPPAVLILKELNRPTFHQPSTTR
jgi:hypothetical protein